MKCRQAYNVVMDFSLDISQIKDGKKIPVLDSFLFPFVIIFVLQPEQAINGDINYLSELSVEEEAVNVRER